MKIKWSKLIIYLTIWLATELFLTFLGMDDLADYSEFIFERYAVNNVAIVSMTY